MQNKLQEIVNNIDQKAVIFAMDENKIDIERELLDLSVVKTFIHLQVVTPKNYALELIAKNIPYPVLPLTKKTGLLAIKHVLENNSFVFFKDLDINLPLLECFYETFEVLSDLDLTTLPFQEGLVLDKYNELVRMYHLFKKECGNEVFESEIYQMALPFVDANTHYYDYSFMPYSNSINAFFKACKTEQLVNTSSINKKVYHLQVQYEAMQNDFVIEQISDYLNQGGRYKDIIVYFSSINQIKEFVEKCPYPTNYEVIYGSQYDSFFMQKIIEYYKSEDEGVLMNLNIDSNFILDFESDKITALEAYLSKQTLSKLKDLSSLSTEEFLLLAPLYLETVALSSQVTKDCITLSTYAKPTLKRAYQKTFLLGINEGSFPSEAKEKDLLLNEELQPFYQGKTPADRLNELEELIFNQIMASSKEAYVICYSEGLDGTKVLPSLLYKRIEKQSIQLKYGFSSPIQKQDDILDDYESRKGQPLPISKDKILETYHKSELKLAPTELETYNSCPYKYFLRYGLKLKPEKPIFESNAKFGNLIHDLLDNCGRLFSHDFINQLICYLKEKKTSDHQSLWHVCLSRLTKVDEDKEITLLETKIDQDIQDELNKEKGLDMNIIDKACLDIVIDHLNEYMYMDSSLFIDICLSEMVNWFIKDQNIVPSNNDERYLLDNFTTKFSNTFKILLYTLKDGKFDIKKHEYRVNSQLEDILYHGKVDRIDIFEDYMKVIDYKSSRKEIDKGLAIQGFNIQMLLYMHLLSLRFNKNKGAVLYFNTNEPTMSSNVQIPIDENDTTLDVDKYIKERSYTGLIIKDQHHKVISSLASDYEKPLAYSFKYVKKSEDYSGSALISPEAFDKLIDLVFKRLNEICDESFNKGIISISPAGSKSKDVNMKVYPCAYCDYKDVCLVDAFYHESREIKKYSSEELEELLEGGKQDESC